MEAYFPKLISWTVYSFLPTSRYMDGKHLEEHNHDYTRKWHVVYTEGMLLSYAPTEDAVRNLLWSSVEWGENRANAQLARSIEVAPPAEQNHEQNIVLVRNLVQER